MDRIEEYKENQIIGNLKRLINDEISKRIDQIVEAQKQEPPKEPSIDIEDYRGDIETMISEYINYNVTINIDA
jgi:hypothetical protein